MRDASNGGKAGWDARTPAIIILMTSVSYHLFFEIQKTFCINFVDIDEIGNWRKKKKLYIHHKWNKIIGMTTKTIFFYFFFKYWARTIPFCQK